MIETLLIAAAEPAMTAIDAERAFAADAQKMGQWTAFRSRTLEVALWNGSDWETVIKDSIKAE
jgi:hypothetical protein